MNAFGSTRRPQRLGPYLILDELGQGGMGIVYKARHEKTNALVAVKVLLAPDPEALLRFQREAEVTRRLGLPGVVAALDVGTDEHPYYAMEFCAGESLEDRLADGPLEIGEAVRIVALLARTLTETHRAGVIHRDLKPANVLFKEDLPRITDFGLVRESGQADSLTVSGAVFGTPAYMSPEQLYDSKHVGPPTDVYALGVILYRCLTGSMPYSAKGIFALAQAIQDGEPPPPRTLRREVHPDLDALCLRAMHREAARRPSALELADALGVVEQEAAPGLTAGRIGALVAAFLVGPAVLGVLVTSGSAVPPSDGVAQVPSEARPTDPEPTDPEPTNPEPTDPGLDDALAEELLATARRRSKALAPVGELLPMLERAATNAGPELRREIELERLDLHLRRGEFARVLQLTEGAKDPGESLRRAFALRRRGRYSEAHELLRTLHAEDREDPDCLVAGAVLSHWANEEHRPELIAAARRLRPDGLYVRLAHYYQVLVQERDLPTAEAIMSELLAEQPDHGLLLWGVIALQHQQGRTEDMFATFAQLLELSVNEPHFDAYSLRAVIHMNRQDYEPALADLNAALAVRPGAPQLVAYRLICRLKVAQNDEARAELRALLRRGETELRKALEEGVGQAMRERLLHELHLELRFRPGVVSPTLRANLEARVATQPEAARAPLLEALLLAAQGERWERFARPCEQAREAAPGSATVALERLALMLGRDRHEEVHEELTRARGLELTPEQHLELLRVEAGVLWREGKQDASKDTWRKLQTEGGQGLLARLAALQLQICTMGPRALLEDEAEVLAVARAAPHLVEASTAGMLVLANTRRIYDAAATAERVLDTQGALDARFLTQRCTMIAALLFAAGDHAEGFAELDLALNLTDAPYARVQALGWLAGFAQQPQFDGCEQRLQRATARFPESAELEMVFGSLLIRRQRSADEILTHWRRCRELDPELPFRPDWVERFKALHGDHPELQNLLKAR